MTNLNGSAALVTGGARRLGRAIALALAGAGASITIHSSQGGAAAEQTLADLRALGVEANLAQGDLAIPEDCERVVDAALASWGRLDILVNNAGIWGPNPIGGVTAEQWDALFNVNLRGAFLVTQRAATALRAAQGAVVNIADIGAFQPWRHHTPYLATKGGVVSMTYALARDLAPEVRVNAIAPGPVLMPEDWGAEKSAASARSTLLGRLGSPEDIGQAALFLATAPYITGVVLPVDGGHLLA